MAASEAAAEQGTSKASTRNERGLSDDPGRREATDWRQNHPVMVPGRDELRTLAVRDLRPQAAAIRVTGESEGRLEIFTDL